MRTTATIEIENSNRTLFLDLLDDPPGLALRRVDGGLVRIEAAEAEFLAFALILAVRDLERMATNDEPI